MKTVRTQRLGAAYQKAISEIIATKLKTRTDSIAGVVSITKVDVSPDLENAKIYCSIYAANVEKEKQSFQAIEKNATFIRKELAAMMQMRAVPKLHFLRDETFAYGDKIDKIIDSLHIDKNKS